MPSLDRHHSFHLDWARSARLSATVSTRIRHRQPTNHPETSVAKPRRIHVQGNDVDTGLCIQRYCPFRGAYVVLGRNGELVLESQWPLPFLETLGPRPVIVLPGFLAVV